MVSSFCIVKLTGIDESFIKVVSYFLFNSFVQEMKKVRTVIISIKNLFMPIF